MEGFPLPATFTNAYFARIIAARSQLSRLSTWAHGLPPEQILGATDLVTVNDVMRLARKVVSRELSAAFVRMLPRDQPVTVAAANLAVQQAKAAIEAPSRRHGHFDRDVQEWLLPGERVYLEKRDGDEDEDGTVLWR